jgi:3-deoxy-7-phosphoheptulonate synthase
VMLESHLVAGRQDLSAGKPLVYGQSITDACIAWSTTDDLLDRLALAARQPHRKAHREASLPPSAQL